MPSYIVKQPNGLLAEFSTVVDDFTVMDATVEEMMEVWIDKIGNEAGQKKILRGLKDDDRAGHTPITANDGLNRWRDALETVKMIHGESVMQEREKIGTAEAKC